MRIDLETTTAAGGAADRVAGRATAGSASGEAPALGRGSLLRLATAGSVDDGKSTLVGRLLHDTKSVLADQLDAVERVSRERGLSGADLALLTDGLRAEREQGITIDVAYRYFATPGRTYILADCPGHVQYTRNTVTGASTADVVVLLTDARKGVLEQTRRHLAVAALLRVPHVVVAVNKIDLVGFDEQVHRRIADEIRVVAEGLGALDVHTIPTSALDGDNIVDTSVRTPWYDGPSLLELLEQLPPRQRDAGTFRMPVQQVLRPQQAAPDASLVDYRGYAGQVVEGSVQVGDEVIVQPSGRRSRVVGIDLADRPLQRAAAPLSVALRLADDIDIARGDVLVATGADLPAPVKEFDAVVCWLAERPLAPRARLLVKHGSAAVQAIVTEVVSRLDLDTLGDVPASTLALNDIGRVRVRLAAPLPVDDYAHSRAGGAFLLVDPQEGGTLAAGMVAGAAGVPAAAGAAGDADIVEG